MEVQRVHKEERILEEARKKKAQEEAAARLEEQRKAEEKRLEKQRKEHEAKLNAEREEHEAKLKKEREEHEAKLKQEVEANLRKKKAEEKIEVQKKKRALADSPSWCQCLEVQSFSKCPRCKKSVEVEQLTQLEVSGIGGPGLIPQFFVRYLRRDTPLPQKRATRRSSAGPS